MRNNASGTDGNIVANGNAGKDGDTTAYPTIMSNGDRFGPLLSRIALIGVGAMTSGVDRHVRSDEAVVTKSNHRLVEYYQVEIGKESLPHADMFAVVAVKRLVDKRIAVSLSENFLQHSIALLD